MAGGVLMKTDLARPQAVPGSQAAESAFILRLVKTRHDLQNPISHIAGFAEMWLEEFQRKGGSLQTALQRIFRVAGKMMGVVNEGLSQAKIETGSLDCSSLQEKLSAEANEIL